MSEYRASVRTTGELADWLQSLPAGERSVWLREGLRIIMSVHKQYQRHKIEIPADIPVPAVILTDTIKDEMEKGMVALLDQFG